MKRNKQSTKAMRQRANTQAPGTSQYALKVRGKKQMYGPDCCAHKSSPYRRK